MSLKDKSLRNTSQMFLERVLNKFEAYVECLMDQGTEFRGEFHDFLDCAMIDHWQALRDHPQADRLVERMVQTCKKILRKVCLKQDKKNWDINSSYLEMGYRMSKHASILSYSHDFLLYVRHPLPPSAIVGKMDLVMNFFSKVT